METEVVDKKTKEKEFFARNDRSTRARTPQLMLKLWKSKIAIVNLNGVNTEFMKNSVLDNVNIDIFDDSIVTTDDLEVNFMISPEDVGKKRGEVLAPKFLEMNPDVKIQAYPSLNVKELLSNTDEAQKKLGGVNLISVSTHKFSEMKLWNELARKLEKPLYIQVCAGLYGFFFVDLGEFTFTGLKPKVIQGGKFINGRYVKSEEEQPKDEFEDISISCYDIGRCLNPEMKGKTKVFYGIQMMHAAEQLGIDFDPFNPDEVKLQKIVDLSKDIYAKNDMKYLDEKEGTFFRNFARLYGVEYCPVYSVIGSVASQEYEKLIGHHLEPIINWFCYDSQDGYGKTDFVQDKKEYKKKDRILEEK